MLIYYIGALLIILTTTILCDDWTASCPSSCKCKWSNGKKSAICNSMRLTAIPSNLSTEIQVLTLNDNNIQQLNREEFTSFGLINLQKIYLKRSHIRSVHREAFKNLKILVELDLSENHIESLDKQTFSGNDRLRIIELAGNPIKELVADQFPVLPYIRTIDMQNCRLQRIDETAFSNLELLEFLNLKKNLLERLPANVFNHMKNLKTLILEENPWHCDCRLKRFRAWYLRTNFPPLLCARPLELKDQSWDRVADTDIGCAPQIDILRDEFQLEEVGLNITYKCLAHGDPLPTITWDVNGRLLEPNDVIRIDETRHEDQVWSNLTLFNLTSYDAGIYTCAAQNKFGYVNKNFSLVLPEILDQIFTRTPETFWYFGLIVGIFGSIFTLMFFSIAICVCRKFTSARRRKKNIKNSVSFNDQEKKLLDLSITTQDKQESSEMVNTPSTAKTDSIIALEPVQITIENIAAAAAAAGRSEEFPLNVGVFPPPPEFRSSNVVPATPYGNIFISVSLTQDALNDSATAASREMYPDLLNIPKRIKSGKFVPVSVSSYATLPRPTRLSKAMSATICPPPPSETSLSEVPPAVEYAASDQGCELASNVCLACRKNEDASGDYYHPRGESSVALCLNYDNMGRRVTAAGNSILALADEELSGTTIVPPPPQMADDCCCGAEDDEDEEGAAEEKRDKFKELSISTLPPPPPPPQLAGSDFVSL